jgi:hypothetical protein
MLAQEGSLTQSALLSGLEFLCKANYDKKGSFYSAFFQLSIGLERLMKIVIILDYKANNALKSPTNKQLRTFGHDILGAYEKCKTFAADRGKTADAWFDAGSVEYDMLTFLSEFADGARYYNLDQLAGVQRHDDPLAKWYAVHRRVADQSISVTKQEAINAKAIAHCDKFGQFGWEQGLDGQVQTTVDIVFMHELFRLSRPYCVWTVIRILHPFYELLTDLCDEVHSVEVNKEISDITVPYMFEFFLFFLSDKQTSTKRSRWITV